MLPCMLCTPTGTDRCTACTQVRALTVRVEVPRLLSTQPRDCTSLYGDAKLRQKSTFDLRLSCFPMPPKLPASSSCNHPCQQLHKAPSPVSVGTCAQHYVGGDCERSRCRQPAGVGCAACACAVQRTLVEPQEAWHTVLAIAYSEPLNGGWCQLRVACRRHHNGRCGELLPPSEGEVPPPPPPERGAPAQA